MISLALPRSNRDQLDSNRVDLKVQFLDLSPNTANNEKYSPDPKSQIS